MSFNNQVYDKNYPGSGFINNGNGQIFNHHGGIVVLWGYGNFGGGNLKLQFTSDQDVTWNDFGPQNAVATLLSAAGSNAFYIPPGRYRVSLSGATSPAAFYGIGDANGP